MQRSTGLLLIAIGIFLAGIGLLAIIFGLADPLAGGGVLFIMCLLVGVAEPAAILELMNQGFHEVRLTGTDVEAVWRRFDPAPNDRPELAEDAAEQLFVLAARLPPDDLDYAAARPGWRSVWTVLLWSFALVVAATLPLRKVPSFSGNTLGTARIFLLHYVGLAPGRSKGAFP